MQVKIAADLLKLAKEGVQLKEESWPWEPSDALRDEVQVVACFTSVSRVSFETYLLLIILYLLLNYH